MTTKSFETLSILGVITGLSLGKIAETSDLILFVTGHTREELEHDRGLEHRSLNLDELATKCQPMLREQFPELAALSPPRSEFDAWEDEQVRRFGPRLNVLPL